jgi:hypothetical protein
MKGLRVVLFEHLFLWQPLWQLIGTKTKIIERESKKITWVWERKLSQKLSKKWLFKYHFSLWKGDMINKWWVAKKKYFRDSPGQDTQVINSLAQLSKNKVSFLSFYAKYDLLSIIGSKFAEEARERVA